MFKNTKPFLPAVFAAQKVQTQRDNELLLQLYMDQIIFVFDLFSSLCNGRVYCLFDVFFQFSRFDCLKYFCRWINWCEYHHFDEIKLSPPRHDVKFPVMEGIIDHVNLK